MSIILAALDTFELMDVATFFAAIMSHPAAWVAIALVTLYIVLNSEFAKGFWRRNKKEE